MNYEQSAKAQTERLMADGHATILAIESSCDETAAAIVRDGRQVISSVISSPRCAGRQCCTIASGLASAISSLLI